MRDCEAIVPEEERKIYEKAGYKGKENFGVNPALIIIDVITGFTGTKPMPVLRKRSMNFPPAAAKWPGTRCRKSRNCSTPAAKPRFR